MVDPLLELFENEKLLLRITIHHGNRIRFNPASGTGGDFFIGDEAGRSFITLIVGEPLPPMEPPSVSEPTWSPQHVPPITPPAFELRLDLDVLSRF
ncbi:hypothetical protein [Synoicihabitans lomoniglobus]|uniref:Uncharacterized protein n=1 Tax=Synoicihabitans lomoniglobus TaxID=2909285 RepID=A0AAE9ZZ47_9BACT|nr:hypothetical protein [Opitutaceae bacterium LMO-M01]WED65393.1 hypothetical protein PXH66_00835 [Opitutaceae bacterium LMO-M01]